MGFSFYGFKPGDVRLQLGTWETPQSRSVSSVFFQFISDVYNYNSKYLHNFNPSRKKLNTVYNEISLNTRNT
jgi:hypothetical protein